MQYFGMFITLNGGPAASDHTRKPCCLLLCYCLGFDCELCLEGTEVAKLQVSLATPRSCIKIARVSEIARLVRFPPKAGARSSSGLRCFRTSSSGCPRGSGSSGPEPHERVGYELGVLSLSIGRLDSSTQLDASGCFGSSW